MIYSLINVLSKEFKTTVSEVKNGPRGYLPYSIPGIGACLASTMEPTFLVDNLVSIKETDFRKKFSVQKNTIKIQVIQATAFIALAILFPFGSFLSNLLLSTSCLSVFISGMTHLKLKKEEKEYSSFKTNPDEFIDHKLTTSYKKCYGEDKKKEILELLQKTKSTLFI